MHRTYPPSPPDSPPWQRSPDCSVISTPAQPYSFLIQIPLSYLFPPAPLFLPPFMSPFPLSAWISSLSLSLAHTPSTLFLFNPFWCGLCPTHTCTHTITPTHTQALPPSFRLEFITPCSSLCLSLPPSVPPSLCRSRKQQGGAEPLWCCCCLSLYPLLIEWWDG